MVSKSDDKIARFLTWSTTPPGPACYAFGITLFMTALYLDSIVLTLQAGVFMIGSAWYFTGDR